MKRILATFGIATISMFAISSFAQGAESTVSHYKEGVGLVSESGASLEKPNKQDVSFSIRAGYHDLKDSEFIDTSWGAQLEARVALGETPLDIVIRGHYADVKYDDTSLVGADSYKYRGAKVYEVGVVDYYNTKWSAYGGSIQLQWNFGRGELVNPYVAAGAMYEKQKFETDYAYSQRNVMTYKWLSSSWSNSGFGRIEEDDDGTAFVGRVGIELFPDPFYARLEAAYISEIYEDDAQAELSAVVGAKVTDNFRIDLSGTYFTEWKNYYICAGFSILL